MHEKTTTKRVNVISFTLKGYFEIEIVVFFTHPHTHTCMHTHAHTIACTLWEQPKNLHSPCRFSFDEVAASMSTETLSLLLSQFLPLCGAECLNKGNWRQSWPCLVAQMQVAYFAANYARQIASGQVETSWAQKYTARNNLCIILLANLPHLRQLQRLLDAVPWVKVKFCKLG